ncbi:hypothetical protein RRG08_026238, partial [Elysia crispata]
LTGAATKAPQRGFIPSPTSRAPSFEEPINTAVNENTSLMQSTLQNLVKDLVNQLPSYVQDDMDFLRRIHDIKTTGALPPDTLLCTIDVGTLYTNIPQEDRCKNTIPTVPMAAFRWPKNSVIR